MNILITGGTGFIGKTLLKQLDSEGHQLTLFSRSPKKYSAQIPANTNLISSLDTFENLDDFDAVINLAGEPIFNHSWSAAQKQKLIDSRIQITTKLAVLINQGTNPPHTFISGSAIGYYGDHPQLTMTEKMPPADDFLGKLCKQWEDTALTANTRVCLLRTGLVLGSYGGVLGRLLPLYSHWLGGKIGDGQQYWSWISLPDMVNAILFLLKNPDCSGAFNMVSPNPVTNQEFNATLARLMKRSAILHIPAAVLKTLLGERACLLLNSQKIYPEKLLKSGFQFECPTLEATLSKVLNN
ncbi:TIGR01777 family oxidoreductase [Gallibacterium salpingitidis]|uniref:Epimerase n=1 Tax=Gallibacterium salpingitidis TaxID=505341 RepID=A0A1A7NSR8_9PAST|nr:TIGR01777 family oxidoreductase [Gallibacterium salpingitidis]OBW92660.1 epimerase [Gallibacterium salpingitidis]